MFGRRESTSGATETPDTTPRTTIDDQDEPEHYQGDVHRRDDGSLRPATGMTPGAAAGYASSRRHTDTTPVVESTTVVARGGLQVGSVLTGVVVAFGAMMILTALIGGIFVASGFEPGDAAGNEGIPIAIGALLVIAQFASYYWGGYTAGRMARGAGVMNGLLVPIVALLVVFGIGAVVRAMGADLTGMNVPFAAEELNVSGDVALQFGIGLGIATLVAMFSGAMLGGMMGHRWHDKLEVGDVRGTRTQVAA